MTNERILQDTAVLDSRWLEAAQEMLACAWELETQAEEYGDALVSQVIQGSLSTDDLRAGVSWVNALDREAVELSGGDTDTLGPADHLEATARRIAHHAGRNALNRVGSRRRLQNMTAGERTSLRGIGMGWPETHDMRTVNEAF